MFLSCLLTTPAIAAEQNPAGSRNAIQLGEQIYRNGLLPNGEPVQAVTGSGTPLDGSQLTCEGCHRRSGFGSSEGQVLAPPVIGALLYQPNHFPPRELAGRGAGTAGKRPAYTEATLRRAIRSGIDANGQPLDDLMPRFDLRDEELDLLVAYLESLNTDISPGVTADTIHLATVIAPGVEADKRTAMLATLRTYFADLNAGTRLESRRSEHAPWHKAWQYESYRKFELHVWELSGPAGTWRTQMERYYTQQPVFALVNGIGTGSWLPVHQYCEAARIPCLFPTTDLPVISQGDFYSLYFSKGISLEATALAKYLHTERPPLASERVAQVFRAEQPASVAAELLKTTLAGYGVTNVENYEVPLSVHLTPDFWMTLLQPEPVARLILWLSPADLKHLDTLAAMRRGGPKEIYLSSRLLNRNTQSIPAEIRDIAYLVEPFILPESMDRSLVRLTAWARSKRLPVTDQRVMGNAYFAAMVTADAIKHIRSNLKREYLIERIEHLIDNVLFSSVYPHLSLGPEQRFAAKGSHIVGPLSAETAHGQGFVKVWIVPN